MHYFVSTDLAKTFNAEQFIEDGYQNAIASEDHVVLINKNESKDLRKYISKTYVDFYSYPWLDTSAISFMDLAWSFENYIVEKTAVFDDTH